MHLGTWSDSCEKRGSSEHFQPQSQALQMSVNRNPAQAKCKTLASSPQPVTCKYPPHAGFSVPYLQCSPWKTQPLTQGSVISNYYCTCNKPVHSHMCVGKQRECWTPDSRGGPCTKAYSMFAGSAQQGQGLVTLAIADRLTGRCSLPYS